MLKIADDYVYGLDHDSVRVPANHTECGRTCKKHVLPERLNKFLPSVDSTSDFHMSLPVLDFKSEGI